MIDRPDLTSFRNNLAGSAKPPSALASPPKASALGDKPSPAIRYLDRPDVDETFADSITGLFFDGQTLRIEFGITRLDEVKVNTPVTGRRYPACRVVLPPAAAVDLVNRMQQIASALTQAGIAKPAAPADKPPKTEGA